MILNDIEQKLKEIDPVVFYGCVDADSEEIKDCWNYIVFNRVKLRTSSDKTSYVDVVEVHIVREEYVPDGIDVEVTEKLRSIPGVKRSSDDGTYEYTRKPNTGNVVEMLTLTFTRARK